MLLSNTRSTSGLLDTRELQLDGFDCLLEGDTRLLLPFKFANGRVVFNTGKGLEAFGG